MNTYIQIKLITQSQQQSDICMARLEEMGYYGFEEKDNCLYAYILKEDFNKDLLQTLLKEGNIDYTQEEIPETNWNAAWESAFEPVVIEDFCAIRADFHAPISIVKHEIVITPKMSFGTGHHATTWMMVHQMAAMNFNGRKVLDFGTGTGVLAILALHLGAESVVAIDNDEWSINNAKENFERNHTTGIVLQLADTLPNSFSGDIILANINKNVILDHLNSFPQHLNNEGLVLLSGLLTTDRVEILAATAAQGWETIREEERNGWISLLISLKK
jgi:ribosomal protein L11 methyltransferase